MNYKAILDDLLKIKYETAWFEFKENWFEAKKLGMYISALSNIAKVKNSDYGFLFGALMIKIMKWLEQILITIKK